MIGIIPHVGLKMAKNWARSQAKYMDGYYLRSCPI